jgi:hypothetical protein
MIFKTLLFSTFLILFSCNQNANSTAKKDNMQSNVKPQDIGKNSYRSVKDIPLPHGFRVIEKDNNTFGAWLRNITLKKENTVYTFDGKRRYNQNAQFAVLDITVGKSDLQQCADAVMRLRAEYLFAQKRMEEIDFIDNESIHYKFKEPYTQLHFSQYLDKVFGMCGSASLAKQLKPKNNFGNIEAGDVIIRGGFPGHAVIVLNVAENESGRKIYMIAQSYMPAQDIHILKNLNNEDISPWYEVNDNSTINTPEYTFKNTELMGW